MLLTMCDKDDCAIPIIQPGFFRCGCPHPQGLHDGQKHMGTLGAFRRAVSWQGASKGKKIAGCCSRHRERKKRGPSLTGVDVTGTRVSFRGEEYTERIIPSRMRRRSRHKQYGDCALQFPELTEHQSQSCYSKSVVNRTKSFFLGQNFTGI